MYSYKIFRSYESFFSVRLIFLVKPFFPAPPRLKRRVCLPSFPELSILTDGGCIMDAAAETLPAATAPCES